MMASAPTVAPAIPGVTYPRLVEGARRGHPEDIGGPWGYREFLEAIADPKHERHTELLERFGGSFDPQQFNIDAINRSLASLAPASPPAASPPPAAAAGGPHRPHRTLTLLPRAY
jgi:hypothetical protein